MELKPIEDYILLTWHNAGISLLSHLLLIVSYILLWRGKSYWGTILFFVSWFSLPLYILDSSFMLFGYSGIYYESYESRFFGTLYSLVQLLTFIVIAPIARHAALTIPLIASRKLRKSFMFGESRWTFCSLLLVAFDVGILLTFLFSHFLILRHYWEAT